MLIWAATAGSMGEGTDTNGNATVLDCYRTARSDLLFKACMALLSGLLLGSANASLFVCTASSWALLGAGCRGGGGGGGGGVPMMVCLLLCAE